MDNTEPKISLQPQRPQSLLSKNLNGSRFCEAKLNSNVKPEVNSKVQDQPEKDIFIEAPDYIINEWELLNLIISYTSIFYYNHLEHTEIATFTANEIKKYYKDVTYQDFNKVFGEDGLSIILSFRNGVNYNKREDIWYINPGPFLKYLSLDYYKDEEIYGKNFDKPWMNIKD